jgi:uncharacterized protein YqeY
LEILWKQLELKEFGEKEKKMLIEKIKEQIIDAMRNKDNVKRDILKVALGEIQTLESRQNKISEEECIRIVNKIIEDNIEMMHHYVGNTEKVHKFLLENKILETLIPKTLSITEMESWLDLSSDCTLKYIQKASSDGEAIGIAMKFFKVRKGISVNGKDVAEMVKKIRKEAVETIQYSIKDEKDVAETIKNCKIGVNSEELK